jgi:hypothetical protein
MADTFRQAWTEPILYALTQNGNPLNLAGLTVALVGDQTLNRQLTPISFAGTVGISNATEGIVYFNPAATDLVATSSPYYVRWQITDGSVLVSFYPRLNPITWIVQNP